MSKPFSEVTADVQVKNTTGNEVNRSPSNETSTASLSGNSKEETTRSASRVPVPTRRNSNDDFSIPEPWMETVTPGKFDRFQAVIFLAVEHIISQPEYCQHPFTKKWESLKRRPKTPMTQEITWRNVKTILGIKDIFEYKDFLQRCPNLNNYIRIQTSLTTPRGFDFGVYDYSSLTTEKDGNPAAKAPTTQDMDDPTTPIREQGTTVSDIPSVTPKTVIQELVYTDIEENSSTPPAQAPIFPPFTQLSDDTDESSYVEVVHEKENPKLTPKQDNTTLKTMDESITTVGTMDNLSLPKDIAWSTDDEATGFRIVHYRMFETVTTWMQQENANKSPFYLKWRKATYEGLTGLTKWARVAKIFKLAYLRDYVALMYECPKIRERYELAWDYFDNTIRYKELALPETEEVVNDLSKLNALHGKMKEMAFNFDSTMQQISKRIDDINTSLTGCERGIVEQLNRVSDRLASKVSHHMNSFTDYATSSVEKFTRQTTNITDTSITAIQNLFANAQKDNSEKMEADFTYFESLFERKLDKAIEEALQEIHATADEAAESLHDQHKQFLQKLQHEKRDFKTEPAKPSKMFPNVDVEQINKDYPAPSERNERNDDIPPEVVQQQTQGATFWGKDGPQNDHISPRHSMHTQLYAHPESLPMVDNHSILKRVMLPYPGREQSYTWYLQIKSNLHQYGVYLISADEFEKDKSLCPTEMFSIPITAMRYSTMKTSLYHFLSQRQIITADYTDLRNIINRNALTTDGYRVLYDIMARIHPRLDPDATFDAPTSKDYADIHEYYLYVTAYFMHEQYSGRIYKPRQKVNIFIKGLDPTYEVAISKVRSHMENWQVNDPIVPDNLQFDNLPNKIEKYMEESGGKPVIHRFNSNQYMEETGEPIINRFERRNDARKEKGAKTDNTGTTGDDRKYVDTQCPLCQTYGHLKHQCDRMALYYHLQDATKVVDEKLKGKILANFAAVDAKRRARRVAKLKGTVRQLYQAGKYQAGDQLMDTYLANYAVLSDSDSSASP